MSRRHDSIRTNITSYYEVAAIYNAVCISFSKNVRRIKSITVRFQRSIQLSYPSMVEGAGFEPATSGSQSEVTVFCNAVAHRLMQVHNTAYVLKSQVNNWLIVGCVVSAMCTFSDGFKRPCKRLLYCAMELSDRCVCGPNGAFLGLTDYSSLTISKCMCSKMRDVPADGFPVRVDSKPIQSPHLQLCPLNSWSLMHLVI